MVKKAPRELDFLDNRKEKPNKSRLVVGQKYGKKRHKNQKKDKPKTRIKFGYFGAGLVNKNKRKNYQN